MSARHVAPFVLCLAAAVHAIGCGSAPAKPESNSAIEQSHAKMIAALKEVEARSLRTNEYFGRESLEQRQVELAKLPQERFEVERFELNWLIANDLLRLGETQQAIQHMEAAEKLLPAVESLLNEEQRKLLLLDMATTYLRQAEDENCVFCRTGESCILPIRGSGVHTEKEGSRKAIVYLEKLIDRDPENHGARWLLNVAHMTLGNYPAGVPEAHRVSEDQFKSSVEFPRFTDVAKGLGLATMNCCGSVILDDFDGDYDLDVVQSSWEPYESLRYFRNNGDGTFTDRTKEANFPGINGGLNLLQADYDNDGDVDILVLRGAWLLNDRHPCSLLQNDGQGTFHDVTFLVGLGEEEFRTQTAAWADFDNDGDLDLYLGNEHNPCHLYENDGQGTFQDIAVKVGVTNDRFTKGIAAADYDGDRDMDLYVSNLNGANRLYRNNGDMTFTDVAEELGVTRPIKGFPVWFWDFNNDGALDLFAPSYEVGVKFVAADFFGEPDASEPDCLYQGDGKGGFVEVAREKGLTRTTQPMGSNFGDLDNDGFPDVHLGTGYVDYQGLMPNLVFWNRGGERFDDVTMAGGFGHIQKGHGTAFGDLDNDGDLDLFVQMGGANPGDAFGNLLYENPGFDNHWLEVQLVGQKSNRSAIGAQVRADITEKGESRSVYARVNSSGSFGANPLRQHLGLGKAEKVDRLTITWPTSGIVQTFTNVSADQRLLIEEGVAAPRPLDLTAAPFKAK